MYGPGSCGSTGGPWCNYVWRNNNYNPPAQVTVNANYGLTRYVRVRKATG